MDDDDDIDNEIEQQDGVQETASASDKDAVEQVPPEEEKAVMGETANANENNAVEQVAVVN